MALLEIALNQGHPPLAYEFFVVFSRFEYALKKSQLYSRGNDQYIEPNWKKFAEDLGESFFTEVIQTNTAASMLENPPKQQMKYDNGAPGWRDVENITDSWSLMRAIMRLRNNLFHGGKYLDARNGDYTEVQGAERNDALLLEALSVLELAYHRSEKVRETF